MSNKLKLMFVGAAALMLVGCNVISDGYYTAENFSVICLDGTEYWIRMAGHQGYMAVRIDRETRQPKTCR